MRIHHLLDSLGLYDFSSHNGDVWLWLSGPVSEAAFRIGNYEIPFQLTNIIVSSILTRDACGTLGEIMDGAISIL